MTRTLQHIYLSPHLDDAIFCCGGLIHRQRALNEPVAVITLCAGSPDYARLSPLAQEYHHTWGDRPEMVASRRAEDLAVLGKWKVTALYCDTLDSIYRCIGSETAYPDLEALFEEPHPQEREALPAWWEREIKKLGDGQFRRDDAIVYAPLAAGNHVDHQLGRAVGLRLCQDNWRVWFYEDFPHAEGQGVVQAALAWFGPVNWRSEVMLIDVWAKLDAMSGYTSQIPHVFGDESGMAQRVQRFTAERACEVNRLEWARLKLAGRDGRRERFWRALLGYHAHAERIWRPA